MVPTRAGLIYLQTVKEMLEIHRETMDKLHVLDQGHGAVRLSVAPMLYEGGLPAYSAEVKRKDSGQKLCDAAGGFQDEHGLSAQ